MDRDDYFVPDDDDGALAHQIELECWQRMLDEDPNYNEWLKKIEQEMNHEIPSESVR